MSDSPAMQIAKLILSADPRTIAMENEACARWAHALAVNLGGMMAPTLQRSQEEFDEALELVMQVIREQAVGTVATARMLKPERRDN